MKMFLYNADGYLRPLYDEDALEKQKLKRGQVYEADIREARNLQFHRKFFSLIRLSFEYLPEKQREGFHEDPENWRKYVTVLAGHVDMFYSPDLRMWLQIPKSIAFDKMDEAAFKDFYDRCYTEIYKIISPFVSEEEFESVLANY